MFGVDSEDIKTTAVEVVLVLLLLTLTVFRTLFWCLRCWCEQVNASWVSSVFYDVHFVDYVLCEENQFSV